MDIRTVCSTLYTKQQAMQISQPWGAELPKKGQKSVVAFVGNEFAEIEYTNKVSEYGSRLYRITQYRVQ